MNGDGGSDENGVDGQNISPNSVTTGDVKTTDLTFTIARQADTLFGASNYVLPITKPPEDGSTYALCNSVDAGGVVCYTIGECFIFHKSHYWRECSNSSR